MCVCPRPAPAPCRRHLTLLAPRCKRSGAAPPAAGRPPRGPRPRAVPLHLGQCRMWFSGSRADCLIAHVQAFRQEQEEQAATSKGRKTICAADMQEVGRVLAARSDYECLQARWSLLLIDGICFISELKMGLFTWLCTHLSADLRRSCRRELVQPPSGKNIRRWRWRYTLTSAK